MKEADRYFDSWSLPAEIVRRCGEAGAIVQWEGEGSVPRASLNFQSGKFTVHFPRFPVKLSEKEHTLLKASSIHEPLHVKRKESYIISRDEKIKEKPLLKYLYNIVEDDVMEREHCKDFVGDRQVLGQAQTILAETILSQLREGKTIAEEPIDRVLMAACLVTNVTRSKWDASLLTSCSEYYRLLPDDIIENANILLKEGYDLKIDGATTPKETYKVALDMYNRLLTKEVEKSEQKRREEEKKAEALSGNDPVAVEALQKEQAKALAEGKIHWTQLVKGKAEDKTTHTPSVVDYTGHKWDRNSWFPYPPNLVRVVDYTNSLHEVPIRMQSDASFHNNVRKYLQAKNRVAFRTEKLSGKIHNKNIYRVGMPIVGDGEWNSRIFKTRRDRVKLNTAISLLVDWSGSMSGAKQEIASAAAASMYKVFGHTFNIPVEILSFSTGGGLGPAHAIIKPFTQRRLHLNRINGRFKEFQRYTSGNADADAVMWAYSRLLKRRERRKILMVLSDGSPTDSYIGDAGSGLKTAIHTIRKQKVVELYGIGIQDMSAEYFYGKGTPTIHKLGQLAPAIIEILKSSIAKEIDNGA